MIDYLIPLIVCTIAGIIIVALAALADSLADNYAVDQGPIDTWRKR